MKKIIRFDGAKLREIRKSLGLTQYDLVPMVDIAQTRISDIERNVTDPSPVEIEAFATALKVKSSDFLSDEKDIVVIEGTYKKKPKPGSKQEAQEPTDTPSQQLELFYGEELTLGSDLAGHVLIRADTYFKLLADQEKLHRMQNLLK